MNQQALSLILRNRIQITGAVQGVGFRPFVYRLAQEEGLKGWVSNTSQGVFIEVEGSEAALARFLHRVEAERPPHSLIQSLVAVSLEPAGYAEFTIQISDEAGEKTALVLPDIATCPACLRELFDPANRRYLYPFTNCTHCGPRFSIIEALPYDRAHTSMKGFSLCPDCAREYHDPTDRRFHAQPNACPVCGPCLALRDPCGNIMAKGQEAIVQAARAIRDGLIVAVKGIGGFHLLTDARDERAVRRLRERKHREEKPLALLVPDLPVAAAYCEICPAEAEWLRAPEAPIVLLHKRLIPALPPLAPGLAPGNPCLGMMLPYSPLHHILMRELRIPVVATSGNRSEEPICIDEQEALGRLDGIADLFLVHNRPIARPVDDSVLRVVLGRELLLRRSRGFAPLPIALDTEVPPLVAVGGHLKNTIAISSGRNIFLSQHIGDLETPQAHQAFSEVLGRLQAMYEVVPRRIARDLHPDYISTHYALKQDVPTVAVQHHHAHIVACMAEHGLQGTVLGVAWDGTGYGLDGTVWGGEFLRCTRRDFERVAHLRAFPLLTGDQAVKKPWRTALGLLYAMMGEAVFAEEGLLPLQSCEPKERIVYRQILAKKINCPLVCSAGRLFDAVAAILGLRQVVSFEGQAAVELESHRMAGVGETYPFVIQEKENGPLVVDWEPMIRAILAEMTVQTPVGMISARFHNTLIAMIASIAKRVGEPRIVLSGGCFQNKVLLEQAVHQLTQEGFVPYWPLRIPPNDGGIALGQVVIAASRELPHVSGSPR
ncbi:MAG: carbamoyltransferase HypF [bacterium]|jgi:hydrogenase maturation protein HypF|nr:carbamoyltransferase HypF [bacterium]